MWFLFHLTKSVVPIRKVFEDPLFVVVPDFRPLIGNIFLCLLRAM